MTNKLDEGLDRCSTVLMMIKELLDGHPAIVQAGATEEIDLALESILNAHRMIKQQAWRERQAMKKLLFVRPDGAQCWMVFAGSHSGIAGVTCKEPVL